MSFGRIRKGLITRTFFSNPRCVYQPTPGVTFPAKTHGDGSRARRRHRHTR